MDIFGPENAKLKDLSLHFDEFEGAKLNFNGQPLGSIPELALETETETLDEPAIRMPESYEATITFNMNRATMLSLIYGRSITNNWLKMHGGVMQRNTRKKRTPL